MAKSIRLKLGLILGGFVLLMMMIIGFTFWTVHSQKSDGIVINLAGRQRMLTQKMTKEALALFQGRSQKVEVFETVNLFDKTLNSLISGDAEKGIPPATDPLMKAELAEIRKMWEGFKTNIAGLAGITATINNVAGDQAKFAAMKDEAARSLDYILTSNVPLLKEMNAAVGMYEAASTARVNRLKTMQVIFLFLTVGCFFLGWIFISKIIVKPLSHITGWTQRVADGDLSGDPLEIKTGDEIGALGHAVNRMKENLTKMIGNIRDAASQVSTASDQISRGNEDLSQRISEQAASVQETAATMEEMAATTNQNADSSKEADKLAAEARVAAEKGAAVVENMVGNMQEIVSSGKKVVDITGMIDEIAFQTNLLALNAAVEAARAGEHGRGFAVVASEVRSLAQRSASAAKEISSILKSNMTKTEEGAGLAQETKVSLDEIIVNVKKTADLIAEISAASQEQANGIDQVNIAIGQMDQVSQQNSALVMETGTATQQMAAQAESLLGLVEYFKLDADGTVPAEGSKVSPLSSHKEGPLANVHHLYKKRDDRQSVQGPSQSDLQPDTYEKDAFVEL